MLHLAIDSKEFTYLNYLAVMSAIKVADVTFWTRQTPENNKYWDIVKKVKSITWKEIDPQTGITIDQYDYTGRLDIIYFGGLTARMLDDAMIDHKDMYKVGGEFERKDICLVRVFKPELITHDYVKNSGTAIAELIQKALFERVWDVKEV